MLFCIVRNEGRTCEIICYYWLNSSQLFGMHYTFDKNSASEEAIHLHRKCFAISKPKHACIQHRNMLVDQQFYIVENTHLHTDIRNTCTCIFLGSDDEDEIYLVLGRHFGFPLIYT